MNDIVIPVASGETPMPEPAPPPHQTPPSNPAEDVESEKISLFEKLVSGGVVIGGLVITILLIAILFYQLKDTNNKIQSVALDCIKTNPNLVIDSSITRFEACKVALEAEAQSLRTLRAQTIVGARLFIQAIAMMAGISLMTMGSSFVFARIKGPSSTLSAERKLADDNNWQFMLTSYFPGVILAALGTIIVVSTMHISTGQKSQTNDRPVFLDYPDRGVMSRYPVFYGTGNLSKQQKKEKVEGLRQLEKEFNLPEGSLQ